MCDMSPALPESSVAATESPPPMMVVAPFSLVRSARMSTMPKVPFSKAFISNTPMGPFMMTVLQSERNSFCSAVDAGPLSRPIQPSGMASAETTWVLASAAKLSATIMSDGRRIVFPSSSAFARTSFAVSTKSSSTREVPTLKPLALRKVKTMPPPMTIFSHLSRRAFKTVIFEETLDPPTMAAMGFSPFWMAPSRYSSSLARRKPETDGWRNLVTPSVEAWARWAVPKASFTNMSKGAASFSTKPASFLVSSW
mmetsp:Transcript_28183/g.67189  ORF Transcript_28183/g.67189 Transcript_28183/m.67189 type:complete len:254 (-) Transcript_28183:584-1345(-)